MAEISQIEVNNTTYNVYDAAAQDCLSDTDLINGNLHLNDGTIKIIDNDIEVDTVPSSDQYAPVIEWTDANGKQMGYIHSQYGNNDKVKIALGVHRNISDTDIYGTALLSMDSTGKPAFALFADSAGGCDLNVTGNATIVGTLDVTGTTSLHSDMNMALNDGAATHLLFKDSRMDRSYNGVTTTGTQVERCVGAQDKDDYWVGRLTFRQGADGLKQTRLETAGTNSSGTTVWNTISAAVDKNGTRSYVVSDPAAFCETLHVGDRVEKDQSTAVSIADSSWKNICSISLAAGTWIIEATAQYAANATGRRYAAISETTNAASAAVQRETCNSIPAVNGGTTFIHTGCTKVLTATTTIYLVGWQNSGAALNTYGHISAVRIK